MGKNKFTNLFTPLKINNKIYRNRIVSAPMTFALSALDPQLREKSFRKLEARAKGGAAAVTLGELDVNFTDADRLPFPAVDFTDCQSEAFHVFEEYAARIHKHSAVALGELSHAGSEKVPFPGQKDPVGPVEMITSQHIHVCAATPADMTRIANDFAAAAVYLQKAGFDGLTIHAGHGFLFTQFLSARTNTRTDCYGGSLENRAAFPIAILKAIRAAVGPSFILDMRLSAAENVPGGITIEETGQFCQLIETLVDSIHLSDGLYTSPVATRQFSSMFTPHGFNATAAAIIKTYTKLPVGVIGGINSPELAEKIIASGQADFIILGRQMICDPEFANKAASGREAEIRHCIRCYHCFPGSPEEGYTDIPCDGPTLSTKVGICALNPATNPEIMFGDFPAPHGHRKVLIIGGGPAGMEAAIIACDRGHDVTIIDSRKTLGGTLYFTDIDVDKPDLRDFKNNLIAQVKNRHIEVLLNTEADAAYIKAAHPDVLIIAIGAMPAYPAIPGLSSAFPAMDVFADPVIDGQNIIMLGGGLVGCEAGLHLAKTGHNVTIIEMLDKIAKDSYGMYREALLREMAQCHIKLLLGTRCLEVSGNTVRIAAPDRTEHILTADRIFHALGMKALDTAALRRAADTIPTFEIGNCRRPGQVDKALKDGYLAAMKII